MGYPPWASTAALLSLVFLGFLTVSSRSTRSEEDRDTMWDAWGPWSDCSRTCGGGASYSLRRCLNGRNCEGRNIRYQTCSNVDCPPEVGDFRAQQCSAHNDVRFHGMLYEWLPVYNDPENPCSLKCQATGTSLVVELAPKVLDGTRCYTESLDMCISGACQIVGCDHELGSTAKEDNCGLCNGDGSTCRLVRGQYKPQPGSHKMEDIVIAIPYGSRHVRLVLKGPGHLYLETKTLQGIRGENSLNSTGSSNLANTTIDFQTFSDKEILRMSGPLGADFTVKIHHVGATDSVVQFIFYQPISHRWRETDYFPCSVTCGGGYQLTSSECYDLRSGRVVPDQYCNYYPENVKPKPKLQECNMDPCPASDGYKQIMPYDIYHPLPRWESTPWTSCSSSCGGGIQTRTVSCVEEDIQGTIIPVEEWKCMYTLKMATVQPCNIFDCPKWFAQEWSLCTVTCGQGLWYRVVLCMDHRGQHAGGCNPKTKPHVKEECTTSIPCYKSREKIPVEAKIPWYKQAQELEEVEILSGEPTFIPSQWSPCSTTCGVGAQVRTVKCQVFLSFSQNVADLPDDECQDPKPLTQRACYTGPCSGESQEYNPAEDDVLYGGLHDIDELYDWEYEGFTECSESCGGGIQEAVAVCLNKQTQETVDESLCMSSRRPPQLLKACRLEPCPPRWEHGNWSACSATCGVGLQTRDVFCFHLLSRETNETVILGDKNCHRPKPVVVQACNRFDCPPAWYPMEWQECSQTCGKGMQSREVLCKQRMSDGSFLELPETFCPASRPVIQQVCGHKDCPAEWTPSNWSQCSVSCGEGTQSRIVICKKMLQDGIYITVNSSQCSSVPDPQLVKPCSLPSCPKSSRPSQKQDPHILAVKKIYIQSRKEKKLQFVVGGHAYLLPKTSVVLRCPVRRFRKSLIAWQKDGKPLSSSTRVTVAPYGYIKIHHLNPSDIGSYTCVAGTATEHFVIKLIGNNNKLLVSPSLLLDEDTPGKDSLNESLSPKEKNFRKRLSNGSVPEKHDLFLDQSSQYDHIISKLLDMKAVSKENLDSPELQDSKERNMSSEEDHSLESVSPLTITTEQRRLDDIIRNLSKQPEEFKDIYTERLIAQLMSEILKSSMENREASSKLDKPRTNYFSIKSPSHKSDSKHTLPVKTSKHSDLTNLTHSTRLPSKHYRGPVILQKTPAAQPGASLEIVVYVGQTVMLGTWTLSLIINCEAVGSPEPVISWTKNGEKIKYSSRINFLPDNSLQILAPSGEDVGFYSCNASNNFGSSTLSTAVTLAGKPVIKTSRAVTVNLYSLSSSVDVGSVMKTIPGVNITIRCFAKGVPDPEITWFKNKARLSHHGAALLINNAEMSDQGLYSCQAANIQGKVLANTQLLILDPLQTLLAFADLGTVLSSPGPTVHSVLATTSGTRLQLNSGSSVLIGCPLPDRSTSNITWFHNGKLVQRMPRLRYQLMAAGQIFQLRNITKGHQGEISCLTQSGLGSLLRKTVLEVKDYQWSLGSLSVCSAPCGNKGVQYPNVKCLLENVEVNVSHCMAKAKPASQPILCNRKDCSPRWMVTHWSQCSQSCGDEGIHRRRVTCQKVTATGVVMSLPDSSCAQIVRRPLDTQSCNRKPCGEWSGSAWGQCIGQCIGPRLATQQRQVFCQAKNGTVLSSEHCSSLPRPSSTQNCSKESCNTQWRISTWTQCTATCGTYGFQSRRVDCVNLRLNKSVREQLCSWKPRPVNWQRCNITPCENVECRDTTRYCEKVKQLKLCQLSQFKLRCCESCQDA
ncbi:ADAMTS-like protein 1 [Protopterus annectens]|uniref:ADAMTS-like protein 1 n=1 Tax=Protopterus annectens TaxID=7888 RepID=UPI001CF97EC7|nr:ADAMTS-like protein 1 [Protopterus annectens]